MSPVLVTRSCYSREITVVVLVLGVDCLVVPIEGFGVGFPKPFYSLLGFGVVWGSQWLFGHVSFCKVEELDEASSSDASGRGGTFLARVNGRGGEGG